ncbi:MAG: Slx4p interacting protein [Claussenomyces sp. TS43310]|nr:MAG: Slx4p interacting protein [Claussenomyces sp. TS43310]
MSSALSNLHLLLQVPSFSRWPLELRFFAPDVHKAWVKYTARQTSDTRDNLPVFCDFPASTNSANTVASIGEATSSMTSGDALIPHRSVGSLASKPSEGKQTPEHDIHALPVTYSRLKSYLLKTKDIFDFEQEGTCSVCSELLAHDGGIYSVCPNPACGSVSHMSCLSSHFLESQGLGSEEIVPIQGTCPKCKEPIQWIDVMKELTLRTRGQHEVAKLLKPPRRKAPATGQRAREEKAVDGSKEKRAKTIVRTRSKEDRTEDGADMNGLAISSGAAMLSVGLASDDNDDVELNDSEDMSEDEFTEISDDEDLVGNSEAESSTHVTVDDSDEETEIERRSLGPGEVKAGASTMELNTAQRTTDPRKGAKSEMSIVIEDSDWDDAEIID